MFCEQRKEAVWQLEQVEETTPIARLRQEEDRLKARIGPLDATMNESRDAAAADALGLLLPTLKMSNEHIGLKFRHTTVAVL